MGLRGDGLIAGCLEKIIKMGGNDRSEAPLPKFNESQGEDRRSAKAPTRTLMNFERVTFQARSHWPNEEVAGVTSHSVTILVAVVEFFLRIAAGGTNS